MSSLLQLRTATRRYINEEDSTNSHFTDSEINDYLNQAVTFLATQMEWPQQVDQAVAVTNQTLYQLPSDFIALSDVYFDNQKIIILDRVDLGQISPSWQNDPSSIPKVAYRFNNDTVGLYPTPDVTQNGKIIQIQYVHLPATISSDVDIPDLHTAYQMCLPFYAAFACNYKLGNSKQSDADMNNFKMHMNALKSKVQKYSDDLLRFRWGWNYPEKWT